MAGDVSTSSAKSVWSVFAISRVFTG